MADRNKAGKVQCKGYKAEGERCRNWTGDSSGYCGVHRKSFNEITEFAVLKCTNCPVRECAYRNSSPGGLCYFELADDVKDFEKKLDMVMAMRKVLRAEYLMHGRIERELSRARMSSIGNEDANTDQLLYQFNKVSGSLSYHLVQFGNFFGWGSSKTEDEMVESKLKHMKSVIEKDRKKREKGEEEEDQVIDLETDEVPVEDLVKR